MRRRLWALIDSSSIFKNIGMNRCSAYMTLAVGAVLWDGAIILAGFLGLLPRHIFPGIRVIELGSGVGLAGLLAAAYGAQVTVTDIEKVLPLLIENCEANGYVQGKLPSPGQVSHITHISATNYVHIYSYSSMSSYE